VLPLDRSVARLIRIDTLERTGGSIFRVGIYVCSIASVVAGIMDIVWGQVEAAHQPIEAFGDHIPGREIFAYLAAVGLVAGGPAILCRRTARVQWRFSRVRDTVKSNRLKHKIL
jgi:hypothetical protein